jgi:hypothetical protein
MKLFCLSSLIFCSVFAKSTFELSHKNLEIDDQVIEEIIEHPGFDRLKNLHQYGIAHYNGDSEKYSRFEHSLGVYMLCKKAGVSKNEQIAALLHDASHTAFSHFGDFFFNEHGEDAWQDVHHEEYFEKIGLVDVFTKHKLQIADIHHKNKTFKALDAPLPNLCADRIDYNIQGGLKKGKLTKEEAEKIFDDLVFDGKDWTLSHIKLAEKLSLSSIFMMENCWSCPRSYVSNILLCDLAKHAIKLELLTEKDIVLSTDTLVLEKLEAIDDPYIQEGILIIKNMNEYLTDGNTYQISYKNRALDPMIRKGKKKFRLTEVSKTYKKAFNEAKERAEKGYSFTLTEKGKSKESYFENLSSKQCLF